MNWAKNLPVSGSRSGPGAAGETGGSEIDRLLVTHCGPVLFGGKPAALFIADRDRYPRLRDRITQIDAGVSLLPLKKIQRGFLVLLYRPDALYKALTEPDAQKSLQSLGYKIPASRGLRASLAALRSRFLEPQGFPHEIGFFLGYPPEDVLGFIQQGGKNYKYCGLWKVYGDVEKALALFHHYESCRERTKEYLSGGV